MNEKELGAALLKLDKASSPQQLTQRILKRDGRRIRLFAGLATFFWILATAGIVSLCPFYLIYLEPRLRAYGAGRKQLQDDWEAWAMIGEWIGYALVACLVALLLAAACTILLILFSRRATLRQINASLIEISDQLRRLQPASESQPGGPTESL